ncbi:MAG: hypothetical protein A2133_09845 [Actinobacteria bacterium RBG_16_64_13]|nr:MAG: hypothetical protein A2133_09845 [Actinobacteria bacterium RBG_16_64_13]
MTYYVCELKTRKYRGKPPDPIRDPDDLVQVLGRGFSRLRQEQFVVPLLNARHEVIGRETVSVGALNASIVHPRLCVAEHKRGYVAAAVMLRSGPNR